MNKHKVLRVGDFRDPLEILIEMEDRAEKIAKQAIYKMMNYGVSNDQIRKSTKRNK